MRIGLLVLPIAAALAAAATASATTTPVYHAYTWSQPQAALRANPFAQLPWWIVTSSTPITIARLPLLTTYPWAQPKSAPVRVPFGQPWSL